MLIYSLRNSNGILLSRALTARSRPDFVRRCGRSSVIQMSSALQCQSETRNSLLYLQCKPAGPNRRHGETEIKLKSALRRESWSLFSASVLKEHGTFLWVKTFKQLFMVWKHMLLQENPLNYCHFQVKMTDSQQFGAFPVSGGRRTASKWGEFMKPGKVVMVPVDSTPGVKLSYVKGTADRPCSHALVMVINR